jgi:large subunit ribosomal protein L2
MKTIAVNPINNSCRHHVKLSSFFLTKKNNLLKGLRVMFKQKFGKSSSGKISSWHRQRGSKRLYRKLNYKSKTSFNVVLFNSYDPYRSAFNSSVFDLTTKKFSTRISTISSYSGSLIQIKNNLKYLKVGYQTNLGLIPAGSIISQISDRFSTKINLVRSAGTYGQVIQVTPTACKIKLPSSKVIELSTSNFAVLGSVWNEKHNLTVKGKAGRSFNLGRRPVVRGIAMNPVDHPHGGRTNGGKPSVTPWGLPTKSKFYLRPKKK